MFDVSICSHSSCRLKSPLALSSKKICRLKLPVALKELMHKGGANNGRDCMIMHKSKVSVLSAIETITGLA